MLFVLMPVAVSLVFAAAGSIILSYYKKKWDAETLANKGGGQKKTKKSLIKVL